MRALAFSLSVLLGSQAFGQAAYKLNYEAIIQPDSADPQNCVLIHASKRVGIMLAADRDCVLLIGGNAIEVEANHIYRASGQVCIERQDEPFKVKYRHTRSLNYYPASTKPDQPEGMTSATITKATNLTGFDQMTELRVRTDSKPGAVSATLFATEPRRELTIADEFYAPAGKLGKTPVLVDDYVRVNWRASESGGDHTTIWFRYMGL